MLNCVSVIYLSEQKRLAAKQKEDAWEGKWMDGKLLFLFLFGFLDSLIQQRLKSSLFLSVFINWPLLPTTFCVPQSFTRWKSPHPLSVCLQCYIRWVILFSPLCSYFVHAGTVANTTDSLGFSLIFVNIVTTVCSEAPSLTMSYPTEFI